jgi:2',3'-cyclic-nucleotide 2'-phosphodiesterase/3'-nucleotidase
VIEYIRKNPAVTRTGNGAAKSWRFAKATVAGPVVFSSGANALAVAQAAGLANVTLLAADDGSGKGVSKYAVDLSK